MAEQISDGDEAAQQRSDPWPDDPVAGNGAVFDIMKGGVGKTTLSVNVAERLAARGEDVLYVDLDLNGHVTSVLGFDEQYKNRQQHNLIEILIQGSEERQDVIYETEYGFDFVPSSESHERLEKLLGSMDTSKKPTARLHETFLKPLFEEGHYTQVIIDGGGERLKLSDNGYYACRQMMIPIQPGPQIYTGFEKTWERVVSRLHEKIGLRVLAIVPTRISQTMETNNDDQKLIKMLNENDHLKQYVPPFAWVDDDRDWDSFSNLKTTAPKPGLRENKTLREAFDEGMPVGAYKPDADITEDVDQLAKIVQQGGIHDRG